MGSHRTGSEGARAGSIHIECSAKRLGRIATGEPTREREKEEGREERVSLYQFRFISGGPKTARRMQIIRSLLGRDSVFYLIFTAAQGGRLVYSGRPRSSLPTSERGKQRQSESPKSEPTKMGRGQIHMNVHLYFSTRKPETRCGWLLFYSILLDRRLLRVTANWVQPVHSSLHKFCPSHLGQTKK